MPKSNNGFDIPDMKKIQTEKVQIKKKLDGYEKPEDQPQFQLMKEEK